MWSQCALSSYNHNLELVADCFDCSDNLDSNSILENSLIAKEKIISELNMELHNIETTLSNEREQHVNDIKKLNALLLEKVYDFVVLICFLCFKNNLYLYCFFLFNHLSYLYNYFFEIGLIKQVKAM